MNLNDILVPAVFCFAIVAIIKIVSDNKIRRRLIEKDQVNENLKYLYSNLQEYSIPSSLKWGMVLIGIGVAFIIGLMMPGHLQDEVTAASIFILAGVGLLLYYFLANRMFSKAK